MPMLLAPAAFSKRVSHDSWPTPKTWAVNSIFLTLVTLSAVDDVMIFLLLHTVPLIQDFIGEETDKYSTKKHFCQGKESLIP